MTELMPDLLKNIRDSKPLVHHLTNYVTVNDCANITLSIGASPIMADAIEESADIATISQAVVLNIGTLNAQTIPAMIAAGKAANSINVPVILDPVGAGASTFRNQTVNQLMSEVNFSVIRGNISEIKYIAGLDAITKGVDASDNDIKNIDESRTVAQKLAKRLKTVIAITGIVDVISDGNQVITIANGHKKMAEITGTGCMCTSLIGAYCGGNPDAIFQATATAILSMGIAGEIAYEKVGKLGNGHYHAAIQDVISLLTEKILRERTCVTID
ncbi:MAG: hydroxyethylthiazole kinase [Pseudolactococcus laudensis]